MTGVRNNLSKYSYLFVLLALITVIAAGGYAFEQQQKQQAIEEACLDLTTIADLKASQIVAWRRERLIEATSLYYNSMLADWIKGHLKGAGKASDRKELQEWMEQFRSAGGHNKIMLFRPDAELVTAASFDSTPQKPHYQELVSKAVQTREIFFTDLHYDTTTDRIDIDLVIPIMAHEQGHNSCIAVLLIDIDPYKYLYPLIRTWTFPSFSGETLLVRREGNDVLFLNTLRFKTDAALKHRVALNRSEMPAVRAVLGQEGIVNGVDYRGAPVYAALRSIPGSNWAIITKIDTQEILEPVTQRVWYVAATCIFILITLSLTILLWWRRKREIYLQRQYDKELKYNHELKLAELSLQEAKNRLEERVASRTEELSDSNNQLKQEITERKQVEELLRNYFQAILQSPVAVLITDLDGNIEFVNPKFCDYSGYSYEESIGQNPRMLKTEYTPPETHKKLWETITAGDVWQGEFCNRKKNGELYWEYAKILPLKDQSGNIKNYMGFKEDITRRKQLEKKALRTQKLVTIGQLAGGVAHEVRNPLNAILSITEALFKEKEISDNLEFEPYIQHIRTQVKRLADLMNELLDLGKTIPASSMQPVPLLEICREAVDLWKSSGSAQKIPVIISAGPDAQNTQVLADRGRLVQIVFNLLENAAQHSPGNCKIDFSVTINTPREVAIIRIIDCGSGIAPENLTQVFDPFFTGRKGGTGLGLALVKHFVEDMRGSVVLFNNDPPPGCTTEVHIPIRKT